MDPGADAEAHLGQFECGLVDHQVVGDRATAATVFLWDGGTQ